MHSSECDRQYHVVDQLLSMHSALRDSYKFRDLFLTCSLLFAAALLNACVFFDDGTLTKLGLKPGIAKAVIDICSIIVFAISIFQLKVDWAGTASKHNSAAERLSRLKAKYRQHFPAKIGDQAAVCHELATEYSREMSEIPPIPESKFIRLKQNHLKKRLLSQKISDNPGIPIFLLKFHFLWQAIKKLAKEK